MECAKSVWLRRFQASDKHAAGERGQMNAPAELLQTQSMELIHYMCAGCAAASVTGLSGGEPFFYDYDTTLIILCELN